jgi:type I restriction enzyme M protein
LSQTRTDPLARWEEILPLLDGSRSALPDPVGEFLRALASFVILHQVELEEAERQAFASFDDQDYSSPLPDEVRWSRIAEAPSGSLSTDVGTLWSKLSGLPDSLITRHLRRLPACFPISPQAEPILETARQLVTVLHFGTEQARRDLSMFYEDAVAHYIKTARYSGEFASDDNLSQLVIDLAAPRLGDRIYDPCFGLGGFLSEAARRVVRTGESLPPAGWREMQERSVFGVEINPSAWLIGLGRVLLAGVRSPNLELGNTLERPIPRDRSAEGFDVIVANLPFGGLEPSAGEHFRIKTASRESLFLQHILAHLRLGGRAVVVVPHGVLFRHGADEQIRRQMLEEFHVDAVISLPSGWLEGTSAKAGILCISRREPAKEVVFVGEQLWEEGLEHHVEQGNRRGILLDAIHYRQGLLTKPQAQRRHMERTNTGAFFQDTFDEYNPENGYVTSAGDPERFRDYLEKMDLLRLLPVEGEVKTEENLKRLPQLHGVRLAWTVPVANIARRHWELVAKETGEAAVEDLLQRIERRGRGLKRVALEDIADVFGGVGYDKEGVIDTEPKKSGPISHGTRREAEQSMKELVDAIGKVPLVRVQDVGREKRDQSLSAVIRRPAMYLNDKGMERVQERHRLRVGDILLTASGTVGNLALVPESLAGAAPAKSLIVIRSHGAFSSLALLRLLQSAPYQEWIKGGSSGSVIQHLSVRVLKQLPLLAFTEEQQRRLAHQLRDASDADAILEGFSALSGESIWISFLLNDSSVSTLLEAGRGQGYTTEWWSALRELTARVAQLRSHESATVAKDTLRQSFLTWLEHAEGLLDAMELPTGMERYGAIQSWDKWAMHELMPTKERPREENPAEDLAGRASERFRPLCEVLLDAANTECDRIARSATLSVEVANPLLDAGSPGEIELVLSNPGVAPIRKLRLRVTPIDAEFNAALLSGGATLRWARSMPPRPAGEFPLQVDWSGQLLNGEPCQGAIEIGIAYRSLRLSAARSIGGNPYVAGDPVWKKGIFYGREDLLGRIRRLLHPDSPATVILLEGNRRAGKTSILRRLQAEGELNDWVAVYVSFQGVEGHAVKAGFNAQNLFRELTKEVLEAVAVCSPQSVPEALVPLFSAKSNLERKKLVGEMVESLQADRPFERFRDVLEASLEAIRPRRMLLMLDEFDKIQEAIDNGVLSPNIPENIRFLFHHYEALSGILTGSRRIKRLREEYWSALFGIGKRIGVTALDEASARALVIKPIEGRLVYSESALDHIVFLCARQPFLLQSIAQEVFEQCAEQGLRTVTVDTVNSAADRVIRSFEQFDALFRDHLGTERRRFLVCLIHQLTRDEKRLRLTFDRLQAALEEQHVEYRRAAALKADLEELRDLEVISLEKEGDATHYRIEVPLFAIWLERNVDCRSHLEAARVEEEAI